MGQEDVFVLLRKKRKWMCSKDIGAELGVSIGSVTSNLKKLLKSRFIIKKIVDSAHGSHVPYYRVPTAKEEKELNDKWRRN